MRRNIARAGWSDAIPSGSRRTVLAPLSGCVLGVLLWAAQGRALAQAAPPVQEPVRVSVGLQQLWQMVESASGRLEIGALPLMKESGGRPGADEGPREGLRVEVLGLDDARRMAFSESYALGASGAKSRAATDLARAAYAGVLPSVDLRAAKGRETSTPSSRLDDTTGEPLATSTQPRKEVYAVLSQSLLDLGAVATIRRTAAVRRAAEADEAGARGDLGYDSVAAFYGAVDAALSLTLARAQQQRLERLGGRIDARAQAGGASGADRERIRARVLAAQAAVQDAQAQANQAGVILQRLTGSVPDSLVLPALASMQPLESLEDALAHVPTDNPAVRIARENQEAARHEREEELARFAPVVKLEVSNNKILNSGGIPGWRADRRVMAVLTMPLFSGGADYFKQRASLAKQQQYEFEGLDAERTARRNLQIAYSGLASARQKITSLREQSRALARVIQAFDAQLASTSRSLLDVFDAYQQYHQSQLDLVHASVQAVLLEHQILRVTGQLAADLALLSTRTGE